MPSGLCWLLRQRPEEPAGRAEDRFQCRLGFAGFCDARGLKVLPLQAMLFQCRLGFAGFCDLPQRCLDGSEPPCFNAVSAFLASATYHESSTCRRLHKFQCRLGFSGFCDMIWAAIKGGASWQFQCRLGFSGFCDAGTAQTAVYTQHVSMPSRLFWLLRPTPTCSTRRSPTSFNAVSAFLASATALGRNSPGWCAKFQCRLGFSGFCDHSPSWGWWVSQVVSMPSRLFWLLRLVEIEAVDSPEPGFQCRLGFSGFCDPRACRPSPYARRVSMPSRLFWLLRRRRAGGIFRHTSFNAVSAFLASATSDLNTDPWQMYEFQCRLGFSGFCDPPAMRG